MGEFSPSRCLEGKRQAGNVFIPNGLVCIMLCIQQTEALCD